MLSGLDQIILAVYVLGVIALGIFLGRKETADDYFVNSRRTKTWLLLFTVLSTSVGAGTLLGVVSETVTTGISYGLSFLVLSIVGWSLMAWLAPKIKTWGDRNQAYTFGDYLAARYSSRTRRAGSIVILVGYTFWLAIQLVAIAHLLNLLTGLSFPLSLLIGAAIGVIYTVLSGIKGDFYTDAIQFFVLLPIFILLLLKGFSIVPWAEIVSQTPAEFFSPYNFAGPGFFFASVFFGFMLLVSAMEIWQRVFASIDRSTARRAFIMAGVLKVILILAAIFIGLIALQLVSGVEGDQVTFALMNKLLPSGLLGLGYAGILAILMSTIDSMIIVASATITKDFFLARNPELKDKKVLRIGRWSSLSFGVAGLLVALYVPDLVDLAVSGTQIMIVLSPALLGGLLWRRVNEKAAFWSIVMGFILTVAALPFAVNYAFVPGFFACLITFFLFIIINKNKNNELHLRRVG